MESNSNSPCQIVFIEYSIVVSFTSLTLPWTFAVDFHELKAKFDEKFGLRTQPLQNATTWLYTYLIGCPNNAGPFYTISYNNETLANVAILCCLFSWFGFDFDSLAFSIDQELLGFHVRKNHILECRSISDMRKDFLEKIAHNFRTGWPISIR